MLEKAGFSEGSADGRSSCTACGGRPRSKDLYRAGPAAMRNLQVPIDIIDNFYNEVLKNKWRSFSFNPPFLNLLVSYC